MSGFDEKFIEQLKTKVDIVDLIGQYAHLQKKSGQFWACCPLPNHTERTPSFAINQDGQFYHCFGCGKSGDVIKFIEEVESLEFLESVRFLCDKYRIELPEDTNDNKRVSFSTSKKERVLSLLKDTAKFYVENLKNEKAQPYIEYMRKRGLTDSVIRRFGLGASLDYNSLPKFLKEKGYTEQEMLDSGAIAKMDNGKLFDSQAQRLIFPLINNFGNVVAFCGRILEVKASVGKYKNTRDTLVFAKNKNLYNINNLKKAKQSGEVPYVLVVEGHMDAVSVYNAGFTTVVASMGTALTKEQAKLIKRYSDKVLICYDGDAAGQKGMIRGLEILKEEGLDVKIVCLPDGLDPDDVIKRQGKEEYQKLLDDALPLIDYKLYLINKAFDIKSVEGKRKIIAKSIEVIRSCDSEAEKEERLKVLSKQTGITYESLYRDLNNETTAVSAENDVAEEKKIQENDRTLQAEKFVLSAILHKSKYANSINLDEIDFKDAFLRLIAEYVKSKLKNNEEIKMSVLSDVVGENGYEKLNDLLITGEEIFGKSNEKRYLEDCIVTIKRENINFGIESLNALFKTETDTNKRREILQKISELNMKLIKL